MYSWPRTPLSEYWRHQACWYTWVWYKERRKYGFIYTSVHQRDLWKKLFYKGMYAYIIPYLNGIILSILFTASPIYSYPELTSILSWYCCFSYMIYISPHPSFQISNQFAPPLTSNPGSALDFVSTYHCTSDMTANTPNVKSKGHTTTCDIR